MTAQPRIGIVGAGRSRNGLGPFVASALERTGARVVAVAGRDRESARRGAQELSRRLGREVRACADVADLVERVDALVVSSPNAVHLQALEAALEAGRPCLCEKPLVLPEQTARGLEVASAFAERDLLLMENCQWPFVLEGFAELFPGFDGAPVRSVAMGLGPMFRGRAMVVDSLSHVLSLAQELAPVAESGAVLSVSEEDPDPHAERNTVRIALRLRDGGRIDVAQHLRHCAEQPRPAWVEVDGRRADRRLGDDYSWCLVAADGRRQPVPDPMHSLVYRFASLLERPCRDQTRTLSRRILTRMRCYAEVLAALGG